MPDRRITEVLAKIRRRPRGPRSGVFHAVLGAVGIGLGLLVWWLTH